VCRWWASIVPWVRSEMPKIKTDINNLYIAKTDMVVKIMSLKRVLVSLFRWLDNAFLMKRAIDVAKWL
jgi:hypothetical protein